MLRLLKKQLQCILLYFAVLLLGLALFSIGRPSAVKIHPTFNASSLRSSDGIAQNEMSYSESTVTGAHKVDGERTVKWHNVWSRANGMINRFSLYDEDPHVDLVLQGLAQAKIVNVDNLHANEYERGTSEKWVVTLEGGQKAMMKLNWFGDEWGMMKPFGGCNNYFEMPSSEIASFHLHRALGFRNSVYVTGRRVNINAEIVPVASPNVLQQIRNTKNGTCITGHYNIPSEKDMEVCFPSGFVRASVSYWMPRPLKLYTYPPRYMPFSTPNMPRWGTGLNNQTYCNSLRNEMHPYEYDWYYHELFDFAVIDALMFHYDSKHYVVYDSSKARGLTVRLDHGRSFCSYKSDEEGYMLAPIRQCCILRRKTFNTLLKFYNTRGRLSQEFGKTMSRDPLAPILSDAWFPVLERRLIKIMKLINKCAASKGGLHKVLVND